MATLHVGPKRHPWLWGDFSHPLTNLHKNAATQCDWSGFKGMMTNVLQRDTFALNIFNHRTVPIN